MERPPAQQDKKAKMDAMRIPGDLDRRLKKVAKCFWETRGRQISRQKSLGIEDSGSRGAVTGGRQLDGFIRLAAGLLESNGVPRESIFTNSSLELPGFFRPNKKWDLLVVDEGELVIAIEFKSQSGPSFGNNFNNRTEEALGAALDFWTACRENVFGGKGAPWLGYFLVIEDCEKSSVPVHANAPHFPVLPEFVDASYKKRYEIFCGKLALERHYTAACLVTTSRGKGGVTCGSPRECLSFRSFAASMLGAAWAHFAGRGERA